MLTVIQKDSWEAAADSQNNQRDHNPCAAGQILDRYGREIATNRQVFTLTFNASGLSPEEINQTCYSLVQILEANGDEYVDNSSDNHRRRCFQVHI